jgi:hypothetical protein
VVENKAAGATSDLELLKPDASWQARRYALALNRRVFFVVIAYKPANESMFLFTACPRVGASFGGNYRGIGICTFPDSLGTSNAIEG